MTYISQTIIPKSDQLNADDLIAGPKTIRITSVTVATGDQPVSVFFEGDNGKPWKPCKSMRRALAKIWGVDSSAYIGNRLTLFCEGSVKWGGKAVGGIRISHASGLDGPVTFALTESRGSRLPYTIKPIVETYESELETLNKCTDLEQLKTAWFALSPIAQKNLKTQLETIKTKLT